MEDRLVEHLVNVGRYKKEKNHSEITTVSIWQPAFWSLCVCVCVYIVVLFIYLHLNIYIYILYYL